MEILYIIFLGVLSVALVLFAAFFLLLEFYVVVVGHLKGAPFVRSSRQKIEIMVELAGIKPGEIVVDLGSGDGSILLEAAKQGARGIGIEINPFLVWYSKWRVKRARLTERIKIIRGSFWNYPLHEADAVFLYLWPNTIEKLKEKFYRELKPGARLISHGFPISEWTASAEKNGVFAYFVPN